MFNVYGALFMYPLRLCLYVFEEKSCPFWPDFPFTTDDDRGKYFCSYTHEKLFVDEFALGSLKKMNFHSIAMYFPMYYMHVREEKRFPGTTWRTQLPPVENSPPPLFHFIKKNFSKSLFWRFLNENHFKWPQNYFPTTQLLFVNKLTVIFVGKHEENREKIPLLAEQENSSARSLKIIHPCETGLFSYQLPVIRNK